MIRKQFTFRTYKGEKGFSPSVTLPHQAYTIEELFERASRGMLPDIIRHDAEDELQSQDEDDFVRTPKDLTELDQILPTVVHANVPKNDRIGLSGKIDQRSEENRPERPKSVENGGTPESGSSVKNPEEVKNDVAK